MAIASGKVRMYATGIILAKKSKRIYKVNGIVVVSIIDVEDGDYE
ncbi:hypothetical protein P4120_28730 [Bacillus thuringiensis]|nr:hypothetical protein [Bacillus thuringiensis]